MNIFSVSALATLIGISLITAPQVWGVDDFIKKVVPQVTPGKNERAWRSPDFSNQSKALGYKNDVFAVPKGMEKQVQFWVDVYSKYDTDQGVLHDSENLETIYEVVDLSGLRSESQRQRKIDKAKKVISAKLNKEQRSRLRYQLGQKDRMKQAIFYSGRYIEDMEEIFEKANLPKELTRLAFVESSFNIMARSKVGASGLWQIMHYTAKPYRIITPTVDNRNHPLESTKLAAKLLRNNYNMLDSWPLAITGYNHGPTGVRKITKHHKTNNIAELVQLTDTKRTLGFASRNFYACFLAAMEVEKNASKYFNSVFWAKPFEAQDMKLPVPVKYKQVLAWFDGDDSKAQMYNPHLTSVARKGRQSIPAKTLISIPKDKYNIALISLARGGRTLASENLHTAD